MKFNMILFHQSSLGAENNIHSGISTVFQSAGSPCLFQKLPEISLSLVVRKSQRCLKVICHIML